MSVIRSSREIAQRVDLNFHKRRNRFRRWTWLTALLAAMACTAWLATASLRGQQEIYQPGPLSTAHRMLSNDCTKCHDKWAALGRLTTLGEDVRSVPNDKCVVCHSAAEHQANQIPAHKDIKCSSCHDEHRGDVQLTHIANQHCIDCHSDLTEHGGAKKFALRIDSFDGSVGSAHPEFAIHQKGTSTARSKLVVDSEGKRSATSSSPRS